MAKRTVKNKPLRLPPQRALDDLVSGDDTTILMPHDANVPEGIMDPFQQLNKQKRRFVSALFSCHGDMAEAARVAMQMPQMDDVTALENAFIFRADPLVVKAIDNSVHFLLSRRGELFIGALWKAFQIASTSVDDSMKLRAIEFLAENVGTGLENKEQLIAQGNNANGQGGGQAQSLVELMKLSFAGGAVVGAGVAGVNQQGKSKMVPLDLELQKDGE